MPLRVLVSFCLLVCASFAQNSSFTIDQVMSAPFASSPVAAPKGARVAWLLNERGARNIWVADAPAWKARKITAFDKDDGQEISDLAWVPDGSYLFFARGGDFETGGDNPNPDLNPAKPDQSVWSIAMDGSPAKKITEGHEPAVSPQGDSVAFLRGGQIWMMQPSGANTVLAVSQRGSANGLRWSPDGQQLAFVSNRRDHSFIGIYTPNTKALRYLDPSVDHDSNPVWSPDSSRIAYTRTPTVNRVYAFVPHRDGQPWSIRIYDLKTNSAQQVFRADSGPGSLWHPIVGQSQISWTAGNRIVFPWEKTGWCHLYSIPADGGAPQELTPGEGEVEHVTLSQDGKTVYYSTNITDIDRRHLWRVDAAGQGTATQMTKGEGIEWEPAPVAGDSSLFYLSSSYNERAHATVQAANGKTTSLAPETVPADFPTRQLIRPQPVVITAADGLPIHGQLFLPPGKSNGQRHPALIFFHGGSRRQMVLAFHYMYYYSNAYSLNQYLANQGYVVLSVNYRSGIGYGLNFREAINYGAAGASEFNDVMGAGLYLQSRPDVDEKRIGVWGGSYGGYLTALALSRASDLFAAGVDFHGVHDWSTERNFDVQSIAGGDPEAQQTVSEAARLAFQSSPMASVKTWRSPVLLIHGDDDRNVGFSQTVTLVEALRQQHVSFEELIFPNEIHDFLLHRDWVTAYKATDQFFTKQFQHPAPNASLNAVR
jgi:dipeptidyl aminopeptidase/acylaminoacyl peptidase